MKISEWVKSCLINYSLHWNHPESGTSKQHNRICSMKNNGKGADGMSQKCQDR